MYIEFIPIMIFNVFIILFIRVCVILFISMRLSAFIFRENYKCINMMTADIVLYYNL